MSEMLRRVIGMMPKTSAGGLTLTFVDSNVEYAGASLPSGNSGDLIISLIPFGYGSPVHPAGSTSIGTILSAYAGSAAYVITGAAVSNSVASYQAFLFRFRPSVPITAVTASLMYDIGNTSSHNIPGIGTTGNNIVFGAHVASSVFSGFTGLTTASNLTGATFSAEAAINPSPASTVPITFSAQTTDGTYNTGFQLNVH